MRKDTKIVGAVIATIIIIFAALYVIRPEEIDGVMPWDEIDEAIDGFWKWDLLFNTTEGQFLASEIVGDETFAIMHAGIEVTQVKYIFKAKATTPPDADPWEIVTIDMTPPTSAPFYVVMLICDSVGATYWTDLHVDGVDAGWTDTINIPVTNTYYTVFDYDVDIATIMEDAYPDEEWSIKFSTMGDIQYYGMGNGVTGPTITENVDNAMMLQSYFSVTEDNDVVMSWIPATSWT